MGKVSDGVSKRSGGIFKGAICALDGWVVRIVRPGWRDRIYNPMSFSRTGFYALNVQCIVDDKNVSFGFHIPTKVDLMTQVVSNTQNCTKSYFRYKTDYMHLDILSLVIQHIQPSHF